MKVPVLEWYFKTLHFAIKVLWSTVTLWVYAEKHKYQYPCVSSNSVRLNFLYSGTTLINFPYDNEYVR